MGTEIRTWKIIDDKLTSIYTTLAENFRRETEHLEKRIRIGAVFITENGTMNNKIIGMFTSEDIAGQN